MDARTYYLLINIFMGLIILTGLLITIVGIKKKKQLWIAIGVLIALIPTLISYLVG